MNAELFRYHAEAKEDHATVAAVVVALPWAFNEPSPPIYPSTNLVVPSMDIGGKEGAASDTVPVTPVSRAN
jgi:hypothetical protein